jgi:redox-sensitive bicupin YhaK (pirin superfamily)
MPIVHRPAAERGRTRLPWLDGRHSFSFGDYYDPSWMEWSALRVLNDDRVAPGGGFPTHPHRDMEILTWVLDGALEHKDSMGTGAVIRPGEAQVMRAGTGVTHSEFNNSKSAPVRLLQIWFPPRTHGLRPGYQQRAFADGELADQLRAIVSSDGRDGSLVVDQDLVVYVGRLSPEAAVTHAIAPGRRAWVQVARGVVTVNGTRLDEGDGAAVADERLVAIASPTGGEVLVFDLP